MVMLDKFSRHYWIEQLNTKLENGIHCREKAILWRMRETQNYYANESWESDGF